MQRPTNTSYYARSYSGLELPLPQRDSSSDAEEVHIRLAGLSCGLLPCLGCIRPTPPTSSQTHASRALFYPILRRYVKHASLIERCFPPEKSGDTAPSSSELSYLVYYAQSKPAKLTKVGAFLSRRIARDIQRRRPSDVLVGLRIYDALLSACGGDLNFFANNVLESLEAVLASANSELAVAATRTFAQFCRCHSGATLAIDKDLCASYSRLLRTFAGYTLSETPVQVVLGLCALQAIAESRATYAADCYYELPLLVSAITRRIANSPTLVPAARCSVDQQLAVIGSDATTAPDTNLLGGWAWCCLETLVRRSHGQHSRAIVAEIFKCLEMGLEWQPVPHCVHIVLVIVAQLQPQDQNMVIVETLSFLTRDASSSRLHPHSSPRSTDTAERRVANRQACVIRILEHLFCKPYVLVGISVMEALNVLAAFMLESASAHHPTSHDESMFFAALETAAAADGGSAAIPAEPSQQTPMSDYYHLLAAIGGLAKHQYYRDQLSDMVEYIVAQMCLSKANRDAETPEHSARLFMLMQTLYIVLHANRRSATTTQNPFALALESYTPLFILLPHPRLDISLLAADCIAEALRIRAASGIVSKDFLTRADLTGAAYQKIAQLVTAAHDHLQQQHRSACYAGAGAILCELLRARGTAGIQPTLAITNICAPASANAAWATLLAVLWSESAHTHQSTDMVSVVDDAVADAKGCGLWDTTIEYVCFQKRRASEFCVHTSSPDSSPSSITASRSGDSAAEAFVRRLDGESIVELLGPEFASHARGDGHVQIAREPPKEDVAAADRILCGNSMTAANSTPMNADNQVRDIRARVSVDWEIQIQRDSIVAPDIDVDQLRAALRSGLAMHASECDSGSSTPATVAARRERAYYRRPSDMGLAALDAANSRDVLETLAQTDLDDDSEDGLVDAGRKGDRRVPDDVRDLLDSIGGDNDAALLRSSNQAQSEPCGSQGISTPVIANVDYHVLQKQ
ncbi:plasma membrane localization protein [Coemansia sp. RSA 988]|nr:plasma membrane localization protein [Coemansia sp. RSA 988]